VLGGYSVSVRLSRCLSVIVISLTSSVDTSVCGSHILHEFPHDSAMCMVAMLSEYVVGIICSLQLQCAGIADLFLTRK